MPLVNLKPLFPKDERHGPVRNLAILLASLVFLAIMITRYSQLPSSASPCWFSGRWSDGKILSCNSIPAQEQAALSGLALISYRLVMDDQFLFVFAGSCLLAGLVVGLFGRASLLRHSLILSSVISVLNAIASFSVSPLRGVVALLLWPAVFILVLLGVDLWEAISRLKK